MKLKKLLVGHSFCVNCQNEEEVLKVIDCLDKNRQTTLISITGNTNEYTSTECIKKYLEGQLGTFKIIAIVRQSIIHIMPILAVPKLDYVMTTDEFLADNVPFEPRIGDIVYYSMNWNGAKITFTLLLKSYDRWKIHAASNLIDITDDYGKFVFERMKKD